MAHERRHSHRGTGLFCAKHLKLDFFDAGHFEGQFFGRAAMPGDGDDERAACFKHPQALRAEDVVRLKIREGNDAYVGFAGHLFDPKRDSGSFTSKAWVYLGGGTVLICSNISQDREEHYHPLHFSDHIPEKKPYDVALRCDRHGNVPQIQFNDDGVWHDFTSGKGRVGLEAGPWFPYVASASHTYNHITSHRIVRKFTFPVTYTRGDPKGGHRAARLSLQWPCQTASCGAYCGACLPASKKQGLSALIEHFGRQDSALVPISY